ncbi:MAG: 30S ribosome-binding factor RbfA [Clostridia bacterium]|nr:30S ribosome-binding factor RbfA [Clostridia bacterium]MBQ3076264.1 30S ribosome-binding factor RbfA [Clostridia bacterium]
MAKHRNGRINEEVMRALAEIIRELKDPRVPLMTSVVRVEVTPDLKFAKAYISVMGDEQVVKDCLKGLKSAAGYIRREVGRRVNLRSQPEFHFVADDSITRGAQIAAVLKSLDLEATSDEELEELDEAVDEE